MNNNIAYEKKRKPSTSDQNRKRAFKRKIINTFIRMGFQYIPSNNKNIDIVSREVEVDAIFIYENIWILCEDTMINKKILRIMFEIKMKHMER